MFFFFFNDTATTEIYTLSLHDALPISQAAIGHDVADALHRPHEARALAAALVQGLHAPLGHVGPVALLAEGLEVGNQLYQGRALEVPAPVIAARVWRGRDRGLVANGQDACRAQGLRSEERRVGKECRS